MFEEFRAFGNSTADLSSGSVASALVGRLTEYFCCETEVLDATGGEERWVPGEVCAGRLPEIHSGGGISVRSRGDDIAARIGWRKFESLSEWQRFVRRSGYLQNEFFLSIRESCFKDGDVGESAVLRFLGVVSEELELNYLFGVDRRSAEYDFAFDTRLGLGIGLKDVYPLNYFGKPFVELIGREKLLAAPAARVLPDAWGVLVLPMKHFVGYDKTSMRAARERLRDYLGEEYFASTSKRPQGVQVGWIGSLLRALWEERRRFRDVGGAATLRPEFDWSAVIEEK